VAKTKKTLNIDREVLAALETRARRAGLSVDESIQQILRKELGFDLIDGLQQRNNLPEEEAIRIALEAQQAAREEKESGLGPAYEAAWREEDGADA
jgi:hypothetical protein